MSKNSTASKLGAAFAASAMLLSTTAHAAPSNLGAIDPLVSLSFFGTSSSRAAVCAAGTAAATAGAAAAAAVQAPPGPGCVLPVLDQAPPPVAQTPIMPVEPMGGGGLGILPIVLGAAAVAGLAYLLLRDDDDDDGDSPD